MQRLSSSISSQSDTPSTRKGSILTAAFVRIRERLQKMAAHIIGDDSEAEDTLSEAFIKLWLSPKIPENTQQAEAAFSTTVKRICFDLLRERKAHPSEPIKYHSFSMDFVDETSAEEDIQQRLQRIRLLIEQVLSPTQRTILVMRDLEHQSYMDIAHQLNMQEAAVRMQLSRARKQLRELYRQYYTNSSTSRKYMDTAYYKQLAHAYFEATTTEVEEKKLRRFLTSSHASDKCFDEVKAVMGITTLIEQESVSMTSLVTKQYAITKQILRWAAIFILGISVLSPAVVYWNSQSNSECIAYINGQKITNRQQVLAEMHSTLAITFRNADSHQPEEQLRDLFSSLTK